MHKLIAEDLKKKKKKKTHDQLVKTLLDALILSPDNGDDPKSTSKRPNSSLTANLPANHCQEAKQPNYHEGPSSLRC
jgi:hypothetical protein